MIDRISSFPSFLLQRINSFPELDIRVQRAAYAIFSLIVFSLGVLLGNKYRPTHVRPNLPVSPPSPPVPRTQPSSRDIEAIGAAADEINKLLEDLLKDFRGLGHEPEKRLLSAIKNFRAKYPEEIPECKTLFQIVQECEEHLCLLQVMRPGLFIIKVKGDGNCLFHSLCKILQFLKIDAGIDNHILRLRIVDWMRENFKKDSTLQKYVDDAIEAFLESNTFKEQRNMNAALELFTVEDERKYEAYFSHIDQDRFYASVAEIYAFCKMFPNIGIKIERTNDERSHSRRMIGFDPSFNTNAPHVFTLVHVAGNHFNLDGREIPIGSK